MLQFTVRNAGQSEGEIKKMCAGIGIIPEYRSAALGSFYTRPCPPKCPHALWLHPTRRASATPRTQALPPKEWFIMNAGTAPSSLCPNVPNLNNYGPEMKEKKDFE